MVGSRRRGIAYPRFAQWAKLARSIARLPTQTHFTGFAWGRLTAGSCGAGQGDPPFTGAISVLRGTVAAHPPLRTAFPVIFCREACPSRYFPLEGLSLYAVGWTPPARRVTTAEIRSRAIRRARLVLHRANPPAQRESGTFSGPPPAGRVDFFKMPLTFPLVEGVS